VSEPVAPVTIITRSFRSKRAIEREGGDVGF
jgi:hypothetical protein